MNWKRLAVVVLVAAITGGIGAVVVGSLKVPVHQSWTAWVLSALVIAVVVNLLTWRLWRR